MKEVLAQFPWTSMVLASQIIFLAVFLGMLFWVCRPRAKDFYQQLAEMPVEHSGGSNE